jgi:hypothetical protein
MEQKWTPESISKWQEFYNNAPRVVIYGLAGNFSYESLTKLPEYKDLKPSECKRDISNSAIRQNSLILFTLISFLMTRFF